MEEMLDSYIEELKPHVATIDDETGHLIASALLTFKFGLYKKAIEWCNEALKRLEEKRGAPDAVRTALMIVREHALDLAASRVTEHPKHSFRSDDQGLLAVDLPGREVERPVALDMDNALILLYAVGIARSPDDEQALEEHRRFPIQILESYSEKLTE